MEVGNQERAIEEMSRSERVQRTVVAMFILAASVALARVWILEEAEMRARRMTPMSITTPIRNEITGSMSDLRIERTPEDADDAAFADRVIRMTIATQDRLTKGR